jgi:hypothetical protein
MHVLVFIINTKSIYADFYLSVKVTNHQILRVSPIIEINIRIPISLSLKSVYKLTTINC